MVRIKEAPDFSKRPVLSLGAHEYPIEVVQNTPTTYCESCSCFHAGTGYEFTEEELNKPLEALLSDTDTVPERQATIKAIISAKEFLKSRGFEVSEFGQ